MPNREVWNVYNEATRFAQTQWTDWTPEQTVTIANDPTVPAEPTLTATGVDQSIDLVITPPTHNVDKDCDAVLPGAIVDLAHFTIYYSTSANIDSNSDGIPDSYAGSFVVACYNKNTESVRKSFPCTAPYYFVATCGDKHGNTSICSTEVNATPIASGYEPSVSDYSNNIEQIYEGCGIIALKLQPPKSDWEKGSGYIIYFDEKTSGGAWPTPATWTYLYHGPGPIVLHKRLEADSGSGDFRLYKYKARVCAQNADLSNMTDDSQLSLDNTGGEVTTGTIDDGVASAGYDPSQADNSALIAEVVIAERFLGNEFIGQTFTGGIFRSVNWAAATGSEFDASAGTLKLGGSSSPHFSVDTSGDLTATNVDLTGAITASSGSVGSFTIGTYLYTGSKTAYNDANAGVHLGSDGIGIGNNVFTVSSAGALVATSATITGTITANSGSIGGFAIGASALTAGTGATAVGIAPGTYPFYAGSATAASAPFRVSSAGAVNATNLTITGGSININSGVFTVSAAGALTATSATITGALTAGTGSSISGAYLNNVDADDITAGTLTGRTVRTSSGTTRAEMATGSYPFAYYYGGDKKFYVDTSGNVYAKTLKDTDGTTIISAGTFQGGWIKRPSGNTGVKVFGQAASPGTGGALLDLSSVVGSRVAMVLLQIKNVNANALNVVVTPYGGSRYTHYWANDFPGTNKCRIHGYWDSYLWNYIWALTDSSGRVRWTTDYTYDAEVWVIAYLY